MTTLFFLFLAFALCSIGGLALSYASKDFSKLMLGEDINPFRQQH